MPTRYVLVIILVMCSSRLLSQAETKNGPLNQLPDTAAINKLMNHGIDLINNDNDSARKVFMITLQQSNRINYDYGIGSSYARLGYIEGREGQHLQAIEFTKKALLHFEKIDRIKGITLCFINLGSYYNILAMPDSALYYFFKGITLLEGTKSEPGKLARLYENVGNTFGNRKEFSKAIEYSRKSITLATSINDSDYIVTAYSTLSNIYNQSKHYTSGLEAAKQARNYLPSIEDPVLVEKVYSKLAAAYVGTGEPDSAIVAAKKAMHYSETAPDYFIAAGLDLADAYEQKKEYVKQKEVLNLLKQKAETQHNLFHLFSIYGGLAQANYLTGNYKEAYIYKEKYAAYKDSFFTEKGRKEVAEIEIRYKTSEKEKALSAKQLELAQKELALKKSNQYILLAIAGIIMTGLLAVLYFLQARNRKKAYALQLDTLRKQQEIDMLQALVQGEEKERSRIAKDLHDSVSGMLAAAKMHLNNPGNQDFSNSNGFSQGIQLLDEATKEIRKTSHNLMPEVLMQHGLDEALSRYCNNISHRNLTVQYDSWGDLQRFHNSFELTVYRIAQELLNNVLKHSGASEAMVQLNHRDNILFLTVEDNGAGFINDAAYAAGMGLQSLRLRIKAINGKMEIETSPGNGASVYLEFETSVLEA